MRTEQRERVGSAPGFIAALDQSGGSTPGALAAYGVDPSRYESDGEMFDLVHAMRTRIMTSPSFSGDRILGAILFEMTMDREVEGQPTADYLWTQKRVVPFLKIDKGLADQSDGAQVMNPNPGLADLLDRGEERGIFGTKMRSVIAEADAAGVAAVVEQQFDIALQVIASGLMPIIEPEISIGCAEKAAAEHLLLDELRSGLDRLEPGQQVMFKLTLPENANLYTELIEDGRVLRVVALSGGYRRDEANRRLSQNTSMIASFSRALAEGLSDGQTAGEFNATLDGSIGSIYAASVT